MKYFLIPTKMAETYTDTSNADADVEWQELSFTVGGKENVTLTWRDSLAVSYKIKHILTIWLSFTLLVIYANNVKIYILANCKCTFITTYS
jgi:hypothetical protein